MKYLIVTPAKNEEKYIRNTLDSIIGQTLQPEHWLIVNDHSTDRTADIIGTVTVSIPWISVLNFPEDMYQRAGGTKVVNVVNYGISQLNLNGIDFIVKLDADLTLPVDYFKTIAEYFRAHPRCGIAGGYCVIPVDGTLIKEKTAEYHVRGAFKSYRVECFTEIGGIPHVYNWDGLDELKAMSMGWEVNVLPLEVIHHRPTGNETNKGIRSSYKAGQEYYRDGNDLFIAMLRAGAVASRTAPRILSGCVFLARFLRSALRNDKKNVDAEFQNFIRTFQYSRIRKYFRAHKQ